MVDEEQAVPTIQRPLYHGSAVASQRLSVVSLDQVVSIQTFIAGSTKKVTWQCSYWQKQV